MKNFRVTEISTGNPTNLPEDLLDITKFEVVCEVDEEGNTPDEAAAFEADKVKQAERKADTSKHL